MARTRSRTWRSSLVPWLNLATPAVASSGIALFRSITPTPLPGSASPWRSPLARVRPLAFVSLLIGAAYWYAAHNDGAKAVELANKAVAIDLEENIIVPGWRTPMERRFDQRPNDVPNFGPALAPRSP